MKSRGLLILSLVLFVALGDSETAASQTVNGATVQTDMFTFVRIKYNSGRQGYGFRMRFNTNSWEVDYPTAEENFLRGLRTITQLPVDDHALAMPFTDPEIFTYPFAYMLEVGYLDISQAEADT
ncbi:MAG: DUF4159 domain-containing protein, partial [bacterium]